MFAEVFWLSRPKLYFVKVDVQACFDTIEQSKLLEIIKDTISEVSNTVSAGTGCARN